MKICKIYIKDFQQFQDVELDFTHPETGKPLNKICFIGSNGTGKSTILRLINWVFVYGLPSLDPEKITYGALSIWDEKEEGKVIFKINYQDSDFYIACLGWRCLVFKNISLGLKRERALIDYIYSLDPIDNISVKDIESEEFTEISIGDKSVQALLLRSSGSDILVYSPSETPAGATFNSEGVPNSSVNDALSLNKDFPYWFIVREDQLAEFWRLLIYHVRKREEERKSFEERPENLVKTKGELIKIFDKQTPEILAGLANVWNKILKKAGLEFDYENANSPYQLNDNLKAYVRLIKTKQRIDYGGLSTGIKNFIFRLGHIYSLYFNREIDRGFLLVDEPENSLYPDFLFDLVETYNEVLIDKRGHNNTQMFFATHNPIIAAQFQPYERVLLDWNEDGSVSARKGISPVGDDPNDVLTNDFELTDLMGPEGKKQWEKYVDLKKALIRATDKKEKMELAKEINHIGQQYNFPE